MYTAGLATLLSSALGLAASPVEIARFADASGGLVVITQSDQGKQWGTLLNQISMAGVNYIIERQALHPLKGLEVSGPGGDFIAAMALGRAARAHSWQTRVPPNTVCASGCALIFLAGVQHPLPSTSWLSFHAPMTIDAAGKISPLPPLHPGLSAYCRYLNEMMGATGDAICRRVLFDARPWLTRDLRAPTE